MENGSRSQVKDEHMDTFRRFIKRKSITLDMFSHQKKKKSEKKSSDSTELNSRKYFLISDEVQR